MAPKVVPFFMPDIKLKEIKAEKVPHEDISLREIHKKKVTVKKEYNVEKKDVSPNIKKFEKKVKVYTEDPYSYNAVSLGKYRNEKLVPTASQMATNPLYDGVGKILGLDTAKEWNQYYDKVYTITEWAKEKAKTSNKDKILKFISNLSMRVPSMGARRIDDLYVHIGITK